jgi:hemerythrin-like domain-containing protein
LLAGFGVAKRSYLKTRQKIGLFRKYGVELSSLRGAVQKSRHSVAEHKDIDDLIEDLETKDMSSSSWLVKAKELEHKVVHHLDEEEQEVFQLAGKALSETQKMNLGKDYTKDMNQDEDLAVVRTS